MKTFLLVLAFFGMFYLALKDGAKRNEWLATHCKVIGEISGDVGTGFGRTSSGSFGTVTTYTPGKTGYQCDDNKTYWE